MKWLQTSVVVDPEAAEAVADVLSRFAPDGVAIEVSGADKGVVGGPVTVKAYLPVASDMPPVQDQPVHNQQSQQNEIERALWHLGQIYPIPAPSFSIVTEANWADAWKEHYHPLRVGHRVVIKPTWREYQPDPNDVLIELDPGMAFGTGLHPTTQMCLMVLEDEVRPGMHVLDLGTGSGILALVAAKLGAETVLALDTDPVAVAAARENIRRNGESERVRVAQGSVDWTDEAYDLVVVNILSKVIIALAGEGLAERVHPRGKWVAAGIIDSQTKEVRAALEAAGLRVTGQRQVTDWVTLIGDRTR